MSKLIAAVILLSALFCQARAADGDVVVFQSGPYVAKDEKVQHFSEYIDLGDGDTYKLPLTITFQNGSKTAPAFKWIEIASPSTPLITGKQFVDGRFSMNVSGDLGPGINQYLMTGAGPAGATFSFKITTPPVSARTLYPKVVNPGQQVMITGSNFCSDKTVDKVTVNGESAQVLSASPGQIVFEVPAALATGTYPVLVKVGSQSTQPLLLKTAAVPRITGFSRQVVLPGEQVTIYGENFSPDSDLDSVYVAGLQATVVAADTGELTVILPENVMEWFRWYVPVVVRVGNGPRSNVMYMHRPYLVD